MELVSKYPEPDIAEPITKPDTKPGTIPKPDQDDPFFFPAPGVDPTPKGMCL
jgi:hypothetical protein